MSSEMHKHSLLSLPAEIRLMILRNVLHEAEIVIEWEWIVIESEWLALRVTSNAQGNVLRTCQQMRNEGTSILYSENVFSTSAQDTDVFINLFLSSIGPDNVSMIKHIKFNVDIVQCGFMLNHVILSMVRLHPQLRNLRQITWELFRETVLEDPSCIATAVWHAIVCSRQLPQFSGYVGLETQPRNPRVRIIEGEVRQ